MIYDNIYIDYIYTLKHGSSLILEQNDDYLEWSIYEQLSLGYSSFMYEFNLDTLLDKGYINEEIYELTFQLGHKADTLLQSELERSAQFVRNSHKWNAFFKDTDNILNKIEAFHGWPALLPLELKKERKIKFLSKEDYISQIILTAVFLSFLYGSLYFFEDNLIVRLPITVIGAVLGYALAKINYNYKHVSTSSKE